MFERAKKEILHSKIRGKHEECEVLWSLHLLTLKLKGFAVVLGLGGGGGAEYVLQDFVLQHTLYSPLSLPC